MDREILLQIPTRYSSLVDVDPAWQDNGILLSSELTSEAEFSLVTYQGLAAFAKKIAVNQFSIYDKHRGRYLEAIAVHQQWRKDNMPATAAAPVYDVFPSYEAWLGRSRGAIGSGAFRSRFLKWFYGPTSIQIGNQLMSVNMFETRMMQRIPCDGEPVSFDSVYSPAKAFRDPLIKLQSNLVTDAGEVAVAVLLETEKQCEVVCAIESYSHRENTSPSMVTTDLCPADKPFWTAQFPGAKTALDAFHFIARISKTLEDPHAENLAATRALSLCIYSYNASDVASVHAALVDGTLNGKRHTTLEIAVRQSQCVRSLVRALFLKCYVLSRAHLSIRIRPHSV
tara:strand:+ start:259 stop:1278 length:1020 start_codon:yes stop_codon:yes gene_type:complete